jgi:hypothetical protein
MWDIYMDTNTYKMRNSELKTLHSIEKKLKSSTSYVSNSDTMHSVSPLHKSITAKKDNHNNFLLKDMDLLNNLTSANKLQPSGTSHSQQPWWANKAGWEQTESSKADCEKPSQKGERRDSRFVVEKINSDNLV